MEARFKGELENEVRRLKEFEVSRICMEEAARYRDKMEVFRSENYASGQSERVEIAGTKRNGQTA